MTDTPIEKKTLQPSECHEFVNAIGRKLLDVLREETKEIDEKQVWLLYGRVLNLMIQVQYRPVFKSASGEDK